MSRVWVKICANTSLEDAQHAIRAGADAVGFVFAAESKRRVTVEQVADITAHLPVTAEKFGVFVEQSVAEIADIVRAAGLTGVQMHAPNLETAADDATQLREKVGDRRQQRLDVVQVLHFNAAALDGFEENVALLARNHAIDAVLIDSRTADAVGGTGIAYDWRTAQKSFPRAALHLRLIVAGGLTPQNVRQAIQTLAPWGVDVASGVEASVGKKDPLKVESFISIARQVGAEVRKTAAAAEA
jgi:phosphoribosylanthranilate isomerase